MFQPVNMACDGGVADLQTAPSRREASGAMKLKEKAQIVPFEAAHADTLFPYPYTRVGNHVTRSGTMKTSPTTRI